MNLIELHQVSYRYPGERQPVFYNINLTVQSGEIVGLFGNSGVGKSTLSDIILGLLSPTAGKVIWKNRDLKQFKSKELLASRRYYQKIFQDPAASFPPHQTTEKALADLAKRYAIPIQKEEIAERYLALMGLSATVLDRYPHQISGGEMQRLALVRIMLIKPLFVIADEPTSMLDLSVQAEVVRLLETLARQEKWGLLFISHDKKLLSAICDRKVKLVKEGGMGATLTVSY